MSAANSNQSQRDWRNWSRRRRDRSRQQSRIRWRCDWSRQHRDQGGHKSNWPPSTVSWSRWDIGVKIGAEGGVAVSCSIRASGQCDCDQSICACDCVTYPLLQSYHCCLPFFHVQMTKRCDARVARCVCCSTLCACYSMPYARCQMRMRAPVECACCLIRFARCTAFAVGCEASAARIRCACCSLPCARCRM